MELFEWGLKAAFHKAYSDEFIGELIRLVGGEYKTAYEECKTFYPIYEAHDLRPHVRRAKIESKIRELVAGFSDIIASAEPNKTKTNYHTRLTSNNVIMTVNAVASPNTLVRRAEHRKTYARSAQLHLFEPELPPPPTDAALYVNIIHGVDRSHPELPAFMHAVFPSADLKRYICRINLLELPQFATIVGSLLPPATAPETIKDDLQMGLRLDAKNKKRKKEDGQ